MTRRAIVWMRSTTSETILSSGVMAVAGIAVSVLVVRTLGAEGRGQLTAALLWPMLFLYVVNFGLTSSVLYHVSGDRNEPGTLRTALALSLVQAPVACIVGFLLLPFLLGEQTSHVVAVARVGLLLIPVSLPFLYGLAALSGRLRMREYNAIRASVPMIGLVVLVILALAGRISVAAAVVVPILANLALLATVLLRCRRAGLLHGKATAAKARFLLGFGVRAQAGDLGTLATLKLDQVLLAALVPARVLGLYVISLSLSTAVTALTSSLRTVVQPRVANATGEEEVRGEVEEGLRRFLGLVGPVLLLCMAGTPFILPILYGPAASAGGVVLAAEVLLLATFSYGIKEMCAGGLQALGLPWVVSQAEIAAGVVTVIGLVLVVGHTGIVGIASVSLIAYTGQAVVLAGRLKRRAGYRIRLCVPGRALSVQG